MKKKKQNNSGLKFGEHTYSDMRQTEGQREEEIRGKQKRKRSHSFN